jgi:hypothetical protein
MSHGDQTLSRLDSANAQAVMRQVAETGVIDHGQAVVISVGAIRERSGDRWPRRRDDVYAYVNRKLHEHLSDSDLFQRLNDVDFLLAMPDRPPGSVQAAAIRILEEVLLFFLGAADVHDLKLRVVTGYGDEGLSCAALDPTRISRAPPPEPEAVRPAPVSMPMSPDPAEIRKKTPVSFVTASGSTLRIDFAVEPLINLKSHATAALRIEPTVTDERADRRIHARDFAGLSDDDLFFIDRSTVDYASLYLPPVGGGGRGQPPLVLPASFRSLAGRKGREGLVRMAGSAPDLLRQGVFVELVDVSLATPGSRLIEVVGLVGGLCRGVFVRLRPARDFLAPVQGVRPQGLTLDCSDLPPFPAQMVASILAFGEQARGAAPILAVQGLPSQAQFSAAIGAHATHASVRAALATAENQAA